MHYTKGVILLAMAALLLGCSSHQSLTGVGLFDFEYDGKNYGILSSTATTNGSGNMLIQKQGNRIIMRALDSDKDGSIDKIIIGSMTITRADRIYKAGIEMAQSQHKFKQYEHERMYSTTGPGFFKTYVIQTFISHTMGTYNKFIIVNIKTDIRTILIDKGADGKLEIKDNDNDFQKLYTHILEKGLSEGKIERIDKQYIVDKKRALVVM